MLESIEVHLMLSKAFPDSSGLLRTQIQRQELLLLVSFPQSSLLLLGNHCQHLRNRQPHHLSAPTQKTALKSITVIAYLYFQTQSLYHQFQRKPKKDNFTNPILSTLTYQFLFLSRFSQQPNSLVNLINTYKYKTERKQYILESLLGAPPVTLATRRRASSAFSSFNWANRSALGLPLSS